MTSLTEQELKVKVQQRTIARRNAAKQLNKISELLTASPPDAVQMEITAKQLSESRNRLRELDDVILTNVSDEKLEEEVERSEIYQGDLLSGITNLEIQLRNTTVPALPSPAAAPTNKDIAPKLPKLEIAKYNGDPLLWDEFWDNFESYIHDRADLPTIDKFKYLKSFLEGDALRLADGYRLTVSNYKEVLEALRERFGDPEIATFSHFEALIAQKPASYNIGELRAVLDKCESHIRSLTALGLDESTFGVVFTPLILSKLPKGVKIELHRKNGSAPWRLMNLRLLLKEEINAREKGERVFAGATDSTASDEAKSSNFKTKPQTHSAPKRRPVTSTSLTSTIPNETRPSSPACAFCTGKHFSSACNAYPDVDSRLKKIHGQCHACLRKGHKAPQCRSKRPCYFCRSDRHHQSLCPSHFKQNRESKDESVATAALETARSEPYSSPSNKPESNLSLQTPNSKSILQTAIASVKGKYGPVSARLYIDTGGSRSYISSAMVRKIGAKHIGGETVSVGRFRDSKRYSATYQIFEFDICLPNGKTKTVRMSSESIISCPIQLVPLDPVKSPILASVKLAEPLVKEATMVSIDILVGNDYYYSFIGQEQIRCANGVVLLSSPFGYLTGGCLESTNRRECESCMFIDTVHTQLPPQTLAHFWSLEDVGIRENCNENEDEAALKLFTDSVQFHNNRYFIKWPWRSTCDDLPNNYGLAYGRLKSLLKRIQDNKGLVSTYDDTIKEQLRKGIIEEAPKDPSGLVHYIPHHCVVTPSKNTTKVRIVYDASAKTTKDSQSLNECLYRGPVFLADSVGLILRWRLPQIAMISDIEKAFLQIGLQESEKDATRFLWIKHADKPPTQSNLRIFRFCRVPFGVISSPFLLAATVAHHLKTVGGPVASSILNNIYVDNVFGAASSVTEANNYYIQAKRIFAKASMNLREWFSNSESFLRSVSDEDRGQGVSTKVLGLNWNLHEDSFNISINVAPDTVAKWTKRRVLQYVASIFDPCGYFAPLTIRGKLLMQQLWKENYDWDDVLPDAVVTQWKHIIQDLAQIPSLKLPRRLTSLVNTSNNLQLHCFCDASTKAYSAVVYLRNQSGQTVSSDLIFAKSRVPPVKSLSVPRLELLAVLIGTRILKFVESQLHLSIKRKYIWTDSMCVLHWVLKDTVSTVFVKNRLTEIKSSADVTFHYIPTLDNPADMPSRGIGFAVMRESGTWWHGPNWLPKDASSWPHQPDFGSTAKGNRKENEPQASLAAPEAHSTSNLLDISRYSSLQKLFRVTAYVFRFIRHLKAGNRCIDSVPTASEIQSARAFWDKTVQAKHFPFMFDHRQKLIKNNMQQQLCLFIDSKGIIRCRTRYFSYKSVNQTCYPKLLPKDNYYTDLVIKDCHNQLLHTGVKHTMAELRQFYWVIHARNQVKRVIKRCKLCRIYYGSPFRTPIPPPLPTCRTTASRPFETVGIDYLGPLVIRSKGSSSTKKVWVCLFTCATVRALHLEVVASLSTQSFLLCFRRFIASYGRPKRIISDNAKHFHLAQKTLHRLWTKVLQSEAVQSLSSRHQIAWKFIPELAPWMGGFYERLIGLVKHALKKSIHNRCLSMVELQTLLCEVTAVLNSRPLLYNEENPDEPYLTPTHFLRKVAESTPYSSLDDDDNYIPSPKSSDNLILEWKRIQAMLDTFWKIWKTSYLQSLQDSSWKPNNRGVSASHPNIGCVVMIKDTPLRGSWKIGIITDLNYSHDGVCRSAYVRLPSGTATRRPLRLLVPLEMCYDPQRVAAHRNAPDNFLPQRTQRPAAVVARARIRNQLTESDPDDQ